NEYCALSQIRDNETPSEWKERIWPHLQYFRNNNLLPDSGKKYLKGIKIIYSWDNSSDLIENGIAICLSCDQLVYIGKKYKYW
ncbi:13740_t:CDS:1, partial [Dentiscutata heterogama]